MSDSLFVFAMDQLLRTFGKNAVLSDAAGTTHSVRCSPVFPAKLTCRGEDGGSVIREEGNVLIQLSSSSVTPEPGIHTLTVDAKTYAVLRVSAAPGNAFELVIGR